MNAIDNTSAGKRAFGERVRQLRTDRGWSQAELSLRCVPILSQSEISRIEKARYSKEPTAETLRSLSRAFPMEPMDLVRGTPFASLFAQSEILAFSSETDGSAVMAYFASALTNLEDDQRTEMHALDETVNQICQSYRHHPLVLYRPRLKTSPIVHAAVPPRDVYNIDRECVASADLLILAAIYPSLGAGMEMQLALQSCSSVILLTKKDQKLSKMVLGCPIRKRIVQYSQLPDLETLLPQALDALLPHLVQLRATKLSDTGLCDRLKHFREHRGLSEKDLARMVGVGTRYIQDLESKPEVISNPSLSILRRIAKALSLAEAFLITGHDVPIQLQNRSFAEHLKHLDSYASEIDMPVDDYRQLWKQHVDRYAVELSIPGADRRVEIGDRKFWIEKHESLKNDNAKTLFS